jgi:tRNA dimethylallyltransferase
MLDEGAVEEARAALPYWQPERPWARAIGAPELVAHLRGESTLTAARAAAILASRQYAKRQRTWFRTQLPEHRVVRLGEGEPRDLEFFNPAS